MNLGQLLSRMTKDGLLGLAKRMLAVLHIAAACLAGLLAALA
jgi:hypothetical protein